MKHLIAALTLLGLVSGCSQGTSNHATVRVDGSSTVFPITEAVAEEFQKEFENYRVTVGISGTGGGFKKFCSGETDINDASREIKASEVSVASENNIGFVEIPVAFDGLSIVVNKKNTFVDQLTIEDLHTIWAPGSTIQRWNQVRASWPDRPIALYGPGVDSGTFDYFTKVVNGKEGACRPDFTQSEDDNVLVTGIAGDPAALGFFGYVYYAENKDRLRIIPIVPKSGGPAVIPSMTTINDGSYTPLSRPIYIYVSTKSADRPEVSKFVHFYLDHATALVEEVGYVPLPANLYDAGRERFTRRLTGSGSMDGK